MSIDSQKKQNEGKPKLNIPITYQFDIKNKFQVQSIKINIHDSPLLLSKNDDYNKAKANYKVQMVNELKKCQDLKLSTIKEEYTPSNYYSKSANQTPHTNTNLDNKGSQLNVPIKCKVQGDFGSYV